MGAILKELHNSASKFQFPSMPKDDVDVKRETAYQEYNILGKGKMSYPSGMGTQIIKWSGYFWGAGRKKLASVNHILVSPDPTIDYFSRMINDISPYTQLYSFETICLYFDRSERVFD